VVKGRCSRPQIHDPQGAGHQDCEGAQANRRSDASKGYRDRLVAQTRPPGASIRKEGPRQSKSQIRRVLSQHAPSDVRSTIASCCVAPRSDQRVSSRGLWRTFHVQSPSRLGKARLYLASRQPVELPIPTSTHLLRKSSQIQGFITRMKAEPYDQIAGDYCDLFSRWVKEWQSHRGARWKCGSQKLDVAPSRLATSSSTDQRDNGGGENSRSIPTMTHTIRQEYAHPLSDFSQAISRLRGQLLVRQGLTPLRVIYRRLPSRSGPECRVARSSSRLRVGLALSCLEC